MWNINKESYFKSGLDIFSYLVLYLLYNEMYDDVKKVIKLSNLDITEEQVFNTLQYNNYIRKENKAVILTAKTLKLFQVSLSDIEIIVNHLNNLTGSRYRATSKSTIRFLNARLSEYSLEDIIDTITFMVSKWKGSNMEEYLRPETLFNESKFQSYYNMAYKNKNIPTINRMDD